MDPIPVDKEKRFRSIIRLVAFLGVLIISLLVFAIRDRAAEYAELGYPGIFLIALLANATVILPAPGVAVVFTMSSIFNPLLVALAAGSGGALGELTGYTAGYSGRAVVERSSNYERLLPFVKKYGNWAILILAAIPNPFFDLAGIAAGVTRIPILQFLLFCWIGQLIKMTIISLAGYYSIDWISKLV